jgi:hypothetical protein
MTGLFGALGEEDLGIGFDDEDGVGGGVAAGVELLDGVFEGGSLDGEDYGAIVATDEVEAGFLLDELEWRWHVDIGIAIQNPDGFWWPI